MFSFSACEVLVTSDNGFGTIHSRDETNRIDGAVDCDWVIIGKPGSKLNLRFVTEEEAVVPRALVQDEEKAEVLKMKTVLARTMGGRLQLTSLKIAY